MVRRLDKFRDHFQGYEKNYVLIGGIASSLAMEEAGLRIQSDYGSLILFSELKSSMSLQGHIFHK
jgi:hypothetical protein